MEADFERQFQFPTRLFTFPERFLFENTHKVFLENIEMSLRTSNIFRQNHTEKQAILFTKIHYQTNEKPDKTVSINYFSKLPSARPHFTVSLPCLDNLTHFSGYIFKSF